MEKDANIYRIELFQMLIYCSILRIFLSENTSMIVTVFHETCVVTNNPVR